MSPFSRLALWFALLAALGMGPASAQDDYYFGDDDQGVSQGEAPEADYYGPALAQHGRWIDAPSYGRVWSPWVGPGWRPYVDGYWSWSSYGWLWVSYEPWAWTFHYGRWALVPPWGWVWVPGTVWGPAWVGWYWGDGWVGWAPLSPFASQVTVINNFVFVRDRDFCGRDVGRHLVSHRYLPRDIERGWGHRRRTPPDRHAIEHVSRQPVRHVDAKSATTLAPWEGRRGRQRPERARSLPPDRRPGPSTVGPSRGEGSRSRMAGRDPGDARPEVHREVPPAWRRRPAWPDPGDARPEVRREAPSAGGHGPQGLDRPRGPGDAMPEVHRRAPSAGRGPARLDRSQREAGTAPGPPAGRPDGGARPPAGRAEGAAREGDTHGARQHGTPWQRGFGGRP